MKLLIMKLWLNYVYTMTIMVFSNSEQSIQNFESKHLREVKYLKADPNKNHVIHETAITNFHLGKNSEM